MHKLAYITLGCPKNQVDTETLADLISRYGFGHAESPGEADACLINTCCFIDDAKKESIDAILTCAAGRKQGSKLIVFGCMGQRYAEDISREIPEIDAVFGVEDFEHILSYVRSTLNGNREEGRKERRCDADDLIERLPGDSDARLRGTRCSSYAYLKIADGCSRGCSFCVIPSIRGRFRSLDPDAILGKAVSHLQQGVKELILVAQDITEYGRDLPEGYTLSRLIREIASLEGDFWVRLLYLHPLGITDELLDTIAGEEKVCSYADVPVQHSESRILKAMKRGHDREFITALLEKIRMRIPDVVLRTSLIVGFPGETDEDFMRLLEFVRSARFDRLGVFTYSPQEKTGAMRHSRKVPEKIKQARFDEIMKLQSTVSLSKNLAAEGKVFRALVDEVDGETGIARLCGHAPEIDGVVLIDHCPAEKVGGFADVLITKAYDYDLEGEIVKTEILNPKP